MTNSLENQTISGLLVLTDVSGQSLLFVSSSAGIFRSSDGIAWEALLAQPVAVACLRHAPGVILAGVNGGVLRSTDLGRSWQFHQLASPAPLVTAIEATANGWLAAAAAQDGVFLSQDHGLTWARWNFGLLDTRVFALAALPIQGFAPTLFAGVESGVFASANHGKTWRETSFPLDAGAVTTLCVDAIAGQDELYAGVETGQLYVSRDRGVTWQRLGHSVFTAEINALYAHDGLLLAASGAQVWRSANAGQTWRLAEEWPGDEPVVALAGLPGETEALACGASGVLRRLPLRRHDQP